MENETKTKRETYTYETHVFPYEIFSSEMWKFMQKHFSWRQKMKKPLFATKPLFEKKRCKIYQNQMKQIKV